MATQYSTLIDDGEDDFFRTDDGEETVVGVDDLEQVVPDREKPVLELETRYWLHKPYAFVCVFNSLTDDKKEYVLVEPQLTDAEEEVLQTVRNKLRQSLDPDSMDFSARRSKDRIEYLQNKRQTIREQVYELYSDLNLLDEDTSMGVTGKTIMAVANTVSRVSSTEAAREVAPLSEDQIRRLNYYLIRDFVGFGKIDALFKDPSLEDIRSYRPGSEISVVHDEYERMSTNISYEADELDRFLTSLTERVEKGISRQQPLAGVTLPDGSRAQLSYKDEVSPDGSNFSIRLFNDVPYTPIDQINWGSFSINVVTYLWMLMQGGKSILFSGGTSSGKTTALNAFSMCIPSSNSIVSIEDTREVKLPHKFWTPLVTRESFQDDQNEIEEFQLLKSALRMNPERIVMGEIRGKEGRTLLQAAATGHAVSSTFHAGTPEELVDRFTGDPIDAPEQMFKSIDVITSQRQSSLSEGGGGKKARRCDEIVEIEDTPVGTGSDDAQEIDLNSVWSWSRHNDDFYRTSPSFSHHLLDVGREEFDLTKSGIQRELFRRKTVLAYLIDNGLNRYSEVAATLQAYMTAPEDVLALIAQGRLGEKVKHLRKMKHVTINVDPVLEDQQSRPDPSESTQEQVKEIVSRAETHIFPEYVDHPPRIAAGGGDPEIVEDDVTPMGVEEGSKLIREAIQGDADSLDLEPLGEDSEFEFDFDDETDSSAAEHQNGDGDSEVRPPLLGRVRAHDDIEIRDQE